jgi:hypothetical protein
LLLWGSIRVLVHNANFHSRRKGVAGVAKQSAYPMASHPVAYGNSVVVPGPVVRRLPVEYWRNIEGATLDKGGEHGDHEQPPEDVGQTELKPSAHRFS